MSLKTIELNGKIIGDGYPCYIIAEVGSNHNRDMETAKRLIDVAKYSGCDAVKFQSYEAEGIYSIYTPRISEMEGRSKANETPYELIKRIQMPVEWHYVLKEYCEKVGITFCSTPFDESMVDILESVAVPFYKVASYEITHYPMLAKIARSGKPVILSTGNSGLDDIEKAIAILEKNGCKSYALLHCVSQYPAQYEDINLRCIQSLRAAFDCLVGFSDHTTDYISSCLAIALGASIVEKHITLDKQFPGPDHPFSLEPDELKQLVKTIRDSEVILGSSVKRLRLSEKENHQIGRRSLIAGDNIKKGETITADKIVIKRPALGLHPQYMDLIIGKVALMDIPKDMWITWDCFL
ncbi:MAG: pseudaminic acid synthase [Desulfobacterales bacterium]|nr:pseudaminic acid synthase [Desulfobacterales bacterium]